MCQGHPRLLFTENETNYPRLFTTKGPSPYVKDAFHEFLIHKNQAAVNPAQTGTKMAAYYPLMLAPGQSSVLKLRLTDIAPLAGATGSTGRNAAVTPPAHAERSAVLPANEDLPAGIAGFFELRLTEEEEFCASRRYMR